MTTRRKGGYRSTISIEKGTIRSNFNVKTLTVNSKREWATASVVEHAVAVVKPVKHCQWMLTSEGSQALWFRASLRNGSWDTDCLPDRTTNSIQVRLANKHSTRCTLSVHAPIQCT